MRKWMGLGREGLRGKVEGSGSLEGEGAGAVEGDGGGEQEGRG